jgi:hypothetical protein
MTVYILIDLEEVPKDCVYSVWASKDDAENAAKEFNEMCYGGRLTKVIEVTVNPRVDE